MYYFDIETDGLLHEMTKLHCAVFKCSRTDTWRVFTTGQERELEKFLATAGTLIAHNGICFDKPALNQLGIKCDNKIIDTLYTAWYLELGRRSYGLDSFGEQFGIPKPAIADWNTLTIEEYVHRCTEDVKIQEALYKFQERQLDTLYVRDYDAKQRLLDLLEWRGKFRQMKEANGWKLDIKKAEALYKELEDLSIQKRDELSAVMPRVPIYKERKRPVVYYKKNGDISKTGQDWEDFCAENNLNPTTPVHKYIKDYKDPQPHYAPEVKDWLYSLGWKPETFDFKRNKDTGETKQIPQITIKGSGGKICPSIERMSERIPEVSALVGYALINHRKSFVKALLESVGEDGRVAAGFMGFTNTMRSKHSKPLANIPSCRAAYGSDIRNLLTCEEHEELCGSDMSSLEDRWKHHYQWPIDPEYVKTQMADDFDPHLLVATSAGLITPAQMAAHKAGTEDHSRERQIGKGGNYSCQYGAGGATVARTCGVSESVGRKIHQGYWDLNWSIKTIAESTIVKTALNGRWQLNPVNKFWYHLKADKDRFSTLVQGSGAYSFDMWMIKMNELCQEKWGKDLPLIGDFHDEVILRVKKGHQKIIKDMMKEAIMLVNEELDLNRELDVDVQFGNTYADIH